MSELLVLDPAEVATDRVEFDLTPYVAQAGPDFGDAGIEQYMAQADRGQVPVDFRIPNRQVTIPLLVTERDDLTFAELRRVLQAKVARFQSPEGGWLKREIGSGAVYADIVGATLRLGAGYHAARGVLDADAVLILECLPDWYGDEIELDAITETSAPEILTVLEQDATPAIIHGDFPGRVRIVVEDLEGEDQLGLFGAFRARHYDAAATAAIAIGAAELDPAAGYVIGSAEGGATPVVVNNSTTLATDWTSIAETGALTHVGHYRVFARVRSPEGAATHLRLAHALGDLTNPALNAAVDIPAASVFTIVDLGEVNIDRSPVGTHQWMAQIQARGDTGTETIDLARLWLIPLDESAWHVSAPPTGTGAGARVAWDDFNEHTDTDPLDGLTAPLGGDWVEAGDADGFEIAANDSLDLYAARSAVSDATAAQGCYARLGTGTAGAVTARVNVQLPLYSTGEAVRVGLVVRFADPDNCLLVCYESDTSALGAYAGNYRLAAYTHLTGSETKIAETPFIINRPTMFRGGTPTTYWRQLQVTVDTAGNVRVYDNGVAQADTAVSNPALQMSVTSAQLAAGGALDDGGYGIYDSYTAATARTTAARQGGFDVFDVSEAAPGDAVIYADGTAELRTDGMYREIESGYGYGKITRRLWDLPRIPVSGLEERPVELLLKASRGDLASLADSFRDDIRAQVFYRPCWLLFGDT